MTNFQELTMVYLGYIIVIFLITLTATAAAIIAHKRRMKKWSIGEKRLRQIVRQVRKELRDE